MLLKNDVKRYHYLITLHTICSIAFIIRFIVLCTDLSSARKDSIAFPVIILLLELGSSFITFIANLCYVFLRYIGSILFESDRENVGCCSQSFAWNLSTLTCIRCECYLEYPQLISITRFNILIAFEIMRFIGFILACVCASRYSPIGVGYAILAAFSFIPSLWLLIVEYLHYRRLWFHYHPDVSSDEKREYDSHHLRFLPLALTNDQQTSHWQKSRCNKENNCLSRNLYHVIMYHSSNTKYPPEQTTDNQIVIGFHQTSHAFAASIAKTNFKPGQSGWIGPGIYFATSLDHTEFKANHFGAYICAKVNLGKTRRITAPQQWPSTEDCDTVYYQHPIGADEFCVHDPKQILSWIILIDQDPNKQLLKQRNILPLSSGKYIEDRLEDITYRGCFI
ncbi:unnamed protein product [Adineta steineri]|uniref:PARP catalytic domain-containing protein n=1 Tax=Adineta steineri TaxID=433720 RepID=A0A814Y7M7_9BILA|nr:unnamed protein product [Adineta steineri]CAF1486061.1 unnamed protein product [Adineta steineri]